MRACENGGHGEGAGRKLVAQNKKARHDYAIEDAFEAGLVLVGTEVKSLRKGRASLVDGFVDIDRGEAWLHGVHIPEYTQGTWTNHSARRKRKLLLNRVEIDKIERRAREGPDGHPALALLPRRPGQGRDRGWARARSRGTSGTRWPSGRPTARSSRRWADA